MNLSTSFVFYINIAEKKSIRNEAKKNCFSTLRRNKSKCATCIESFKNSKLNNIKKSPYKKEI